MKKRIAVSIVLFAALSLVLAACGGGGGGGGGTPPNVVTLTADKSIALANGDDPVSPELVTFTAHVTNAGGAPLANQTISFVITAGTGSLINASVATGPSGTAAVQLMRDPITAPASRQDITVKATAASASGAKTVRFINLPTTASIEVALNKQVVNLGWLSFDILTAPTQTPPIFLQLSAIGAADTLPFQNGVNTLTFSTPPTYWILTTLDPGITTTPNGAIVGITFTIDATIKELPIFSVGPDHIAAYTPPLMDPMVPAITQADFVATTTFDTDHP
jgi:hypothetical protein